MAVHGRGNALSHGFEVDVDVLRSAAHRLTALSDALAGSGATDLLEGRSAYDGHLASAANNFADRYAYAIERATAALDEHGQNLIAAANRYDETDTTVDVCLADPGARR
ncbi:hypothetical protein [Actinotalea sp. JY-7876]|uniref:hypothetical protein n=1 Tax=Actinotalea sp. JY-7876 TaxID=2758442 RepID=UPI0015F53C88|nr:hypothetical protein [Actinotalea sp. JY-7876]